MREIAPTHWHRSTTLAALLLAWALLAVWQWQEYQAESEAVRDGVRRQAESVMNALVGGVQSHRRLGRFLEPQIQGMLDELAKSQDVLAAAVVSGDKRFSLSAGKTDLLKLSTPIEPDHSWEDVGFRYAVAFQVAPDLFGIGPGGPGPGGPGPGGIGDQGPGEPRPDGMGPESNEGGRNREAGGAGRGMGFGRGPWNRAGMMTPLDPKQVAAAGRFFAVLLLDRTRADQQMRHYAWLRLFTVGAGAVVIVSVALAWRATVRLAEARGHAQLLEIEARHLRELSQAAAGLAHETRNPLGLIRGWAQRWMQSVSENPQQRQQVQAVIEECDRVTVRINQFLAFARPCQPKTTEVRPAEVFDELAVLLQPDLEAKRLSLSSALPADGRPMIADREMLRQALFNLLQNAVAFSPEGSIIEIAVKTAPEDRGRIEVLDRGPGVTPEAVDLLFTPYHTTRSNGTGLGLATVRRIATAHGWQSGYEPRPGGGAIFFLDEIKLGRDS